MSDGFCIGGVYAPASVWAGVILWPLYGLLFLAVRTFGVARMLRELTRAEIEGTRRRVQLQQERPEAVTPSEKEVRDQVERLLQEAERRVSWTFGDKATAPFCPGDSNCGTCPSQSRAAGIFSR